MLSHGTVNSQRYQEKTPIFRLITLQGRHFGEEKGHRALISHQIGIHQILEVRSVHVCGHRLQETRHQPDVLVNPALLRMKRE